MPHPEPPVHDAAPDDAEAGEYDAMLAAATQAWEVGERFGEADITAMALVLQGRARLARGETKLGLTLLDEAMVSVTNDELLPVTTGLAYCNVIESCREVYDLRRSQEWTAALTRWCDGQPDLVPYAGQCLVHRSEISQLRGEWPRALDEATRACVRLTGRPAVVVFDNAFHGRTLLTMTMTSKVVPYKRGFGPFAPEVYRVFGSLGSLGIVVDNDGDNVPDPSDACPATKGSAANGCRVPDEDGDGYRADDPDLRLRDCDDDSLGVHPGATEVRGNGVDENCDGLAAFDKDGDNSDDKPGPDCDPDRKSVHPGARDRPGNGIDENCDGRDARFPRVTLPQTQPECYDEKATELYDCGNWKVSASWTVPSTERSGRAPRGSSPATSRRSAARESGPIDARRADRR